MKRNALLITMLIVGLNLTAQTRFGVKAGLAMGTVTSNDSEVKEDGSALASFQFGGIGDTRLTNQLSFQYQLLLLGKGTAIAHDDHRDKFLFTALDIPLQLLYRAKQGWFIGGGPNLGFNLSARHIHEGVKEEIAIGDAAGEVKRFDMGLIASAGFQSKKGVVLSLNYLKGLSQLQNAPNFDWQNNVIGISIGYMLAARPKK